MVENRQIQIFSSFGCSLEKLAYIDFWSPPYILEKIIMNYHVNIFLQRVDRFSNVIYRKIEPR
jgi:hypothetical protein